MISIVTAGKIAWAIIAVGWYLLRRPFQRRARRLRIADDRVSLAERLRLSVSLTGLGVIPFVYIVSGQPRFASYPPQPVLFALGICAGLGALVLFRLTHKALGRMWSVSLQLKEGHQLVTSGIYRHVRHPMYSAFWLMAIAQTLLLPNWIAGPAGLVGFGTLFFFRIGEEERMMEQAFGDEYRDYRKKTKRVLPFVY